MALQMGAQATLKATEVTRMKAVDTSQTGLHRAWHDCDSRRCGSGPAAETAGGESAPRILGPAKEGDRSLTYPHRTKFWREHSPPAEPLGKE